MKRGGELIYAGPLGPKSAKLIEYFEVWHLTFIYFNSTDTVIKLFLRISYMHAV